MNQPNPEHERIERLLKRAHLPEPSSQLRGRVTTAARQAWDQTPDDVPWQTPLRRLALSAAATVAVVALAHHLGDMPRPRARPNHSAAAQVPSPEVEKLAEMAYGPARGRLAVSGRGPSAVDGAALRNMMESIRAVLDEMEDYGPQAQPTPAGGRSRLLPSRPRPGSYS